jgi:hypothetical protein
MTQNAATLARATVSAACIILFWEGLKYALLSDPRVPGGIVHRGGPGFSMELRGRNARLQDDSKVTPILS